MKKRSCGQDTNRAFADCYLTPQEIADDPQARAFASALFFATGATDVARPSFAVSDSNGRPGAPVTSHNRWSGGSDG